MSPEVRCRMAVFERHGEGRFVVPGLGEVEGEGRADLLVDVMMFAACTGCRDTGEWLEAGLRDDRLVGVDLRVVSLSSPAFAHGGVDVAFLSGPLFDRTPPKGPT